MSSFRYALRLLVRDWRAGELRLLALALVLAVTAITGVAWLADRVSAATESRASELLGGDRAVRGDKPIPEVFESRAIEQGLSRATIMEFPSVVLFGDQTLLTSVKAVDARYPLRGSLQIGDHPDATPATTDTTPGPGEVWVEPRILIQLDARVGDSLDLGAGRFTITRLLFMEPDRGGGFQSLAPRVMLALGEVEGTGLVQDASRVRHRLLVAGDPSRVQAWEQLVVPELEVNLSLETPGEDQPGVQQVIEAAKRFLGLSALLTVVVGGVAMLLTIRRYASRHLDRVAIMRCLGATERQIAAILTWKMVLLGLATAVVGTALGYGVHLLMLTLLADLLPPLPAASLRPGLTGIFAAQIILLGFALPTVLRLRKVPPLRVLRRDLGNQLFSGWGVYVVALAAVFLLMWWQAGDPRLAGYVFAAVLGTLALLALGAAAIVAALKRLRGGQRGASLLLSGISRRPWTTTIQIMALGLGFMALLLLSVVRDDLLTTWQAGVAEDAPNYFMVNVQPDEVEALSAMMAGAGLQAELYPMVRGRLTGVNTAQISGQDFSEPRTRRLVEREFNLSWLSELPSDNRVTAGTFWSGEAAGEPQFSMETDIAERIGVELGDSLTFEVGGSSYSGVVTSLREVQWDSFNVNFFVIASPGVLADAPATYVTSFHLPPDSGRVLADIVRSFPSVTLVDVTTILETVRNIMTQGTRVVELMALLTLFSGLVVLLAALQVTREERKFESALLRSLGASRGLIRRLALTEFLLLGGAAGLLAGVGAAAAGLGIASALFELDYSFNPWLLVLGGGAGALVVTVAGLLATRSLYRESPMSLLKSAEEG